MKSSVIITNIRKETDKAIMINEQGEDIWLPKSQIKVISSNMINIADWLFKNFDEKGITQVKGEDGELFSTRLRYRTA